jgi:uncharacterized protein DUF6998
VHAPLGSDSRRVGLDSGPAVQDELTARAFKSRAVHDNHISRERELREMRNLRRLSSRELLRTYAAVMRELRDRKVVRSTNNPVADLAELLASRAFKLKLESKSTAGFDGVARDGTRYQIKGRRRTPENQSTQLGAIRNLGGNKFKYLLAILFDEEFNVERAFRIRRGVVLRYARFSKHVNGHLLTLRGTLLQDVGTEDVTSRIQAARV